MKEQPETLSIFVCETFEVNPKVKVPHLKRERKVVARKSPYVKELFQLVACLIARPPTGVSLKSDAINLTFAVRV